MSQKSGSGANISANHSSWNRTPGKPSNLNSQNSVSNTNWSAEASQNNSLVDDMWSNNGASNRNKGWPMIDAPTNQENLASFQGQLGVSPSWAVNSNNFLGTNQNNSNNPASGVWGPSMASNNATSGPRPIRGPQPQNPSHQTNNNMLDQRSRQFSGWNIDSNKDTAFAALNVSTSNNLVENPSSGDIINSSSAASLIKRQSLREGQKNGPSLTDLNALLNTLNNQTNSNGNSTELEEVVKAIINVNDAWGQRIVDQSQPWDAGVASNDENSNSPIVTQTSTANNNPNAIGSSNSNNFSNNPSSIQVLNAQRRMKQIAGPYESNVWPNEPPNGTSIWEAHYENLGERTGWQTNTTSQNALSSPSSTFPGVPPGNAAAPNRSVPFGNNGRQPSGPGYRALVSNSWNDENNQSSTQIWNNPTGMNDVLPNIGSGGISARAINKTVIPSNTPSGRWPPTNQPPPPPTLPNQDTFHGSWSSNPQSDPRKFSGVGNNWSGNDYRNMMLQPPPQMAPNRMPPMHHPNMPSHNPPGQGFFRTNIMRHLINLGFQEEDIKTAMVDNNMDVERALSDLRSKSSHLGLDAVLNPVSSILFSSKFPHNQNHGQMDSNDFNMQSMNNNLFLRQQQQAMGAVGLRGSNNQPNNIAIAQQNHQSSNMHPDLTLNMMQQRESAILQQIMQLHNKSSDFNQNINQLIASNVSSSNIVVKDLQQQRDQILQQIQGYQSQLKNTRSQAAILRMAGTNGSNMNMVNRSMSSGTQNPTANSGDFLADRMMNDLRLNSFPNDSQKNFSSWETSGENMNSVWSSVSNNYRNESQGENKSSPSQISDSQVHPQHSNNGNPNSNGGNASSPLGSDRRWVTDSNSRVASGSGSNWGIKSRNQSSGWVLVRDLPVHVNAEVIKLSVNAALTSSDMNLVKEFESHPNMVARWCLISLAGRNEVNAVINFLSSNGDQSGRFGIPEAISNFDAMKRLEEIQNLAPRGFSGQNNMWNNSNSDQNTVLNENNQNSANNVDDQLSTGNC